MIEDGKHPGHEHQVQRIYLGGIDPSRGLTAAEVWQRLETKLTNSSDGKLILQWSDLYRGTCCLQFTLISDTMEQSPLAIIKSWFHNVMWKGCKLVVDEARPHFLDRLNVERKDRRNEAFSDANITINTQPRKTSEVEESENLTRYWKIRRGYSGEPARHVDTQPCDVTSWSMFDRIRQRHIKQQEKDRLRRLELSKSGINMTVKEAQKCAYYNRSIRFRFPEDKDIPGHMHSFLQDMPHNEETPPDQSIADDFNSDDDSTKSLANDCTKDQNTNGKYVWSDDDSIADSDDMNENGLMATTNSKNVNGSLNSSSHTQEKIVVGRSSYKWSDDENSSSDDTHNERKLHRSRKQHDTDEFESAFDLSHDNMPCESTLDVMDTDNNMDTNDLAQDVERNLFILAQLFPEISAVPAVQPKSDSVIKVPTSTLPSWTPQTSSGWGTSGQMLRFDPSRPQSASLLLVDEDIPPADNTIAVGADIADKGESNVNNNVAESVSENQTDEAVEVTSFKGVYEQQKLEQVFKEAREGVPIISSDRNNGGSVSFSFGFQLKDELVKEEASLSAFSFNFGISDSDKKVESMDTTSQGNIGNSSIQDDADRRNTYDAEITSSKRSRYLAFEFPNEATLTDLVHQFYKMNDGERIISDVDFWRNDPSVKEKWLEERHSLTQDWKRKHKYALSKKQKRK